MMWTGTVKKSAKGDGSSLESLSHQEVRMLTMPRMNVSLVEYMRKDYDNLHSLSEVREGRIRKDLRDKAQVTAQAAAEMDAR